MFLTTQLLKCSLSLELGAENIRDGSKKGTAFWSSISQSFCFTASKNFLTNCEFQEKPAEVTKWTISLLAMQKNYLFNLHSCYTYPCSEPKRKKALNQKQVFLDIGVCRTTALVFFSTLKLEGPFE